MNYEENTETSGDKNMTQKTNGEDYTANEIQTEIQREASDDLSDILAAQRLRENPIKVTLW